MQAIEKFELVEALCDAAIPCINNFFKEREAETFFGFAIEILAQEGYFHVGASSVESFQPTITSYSQDGFTMEDIMGEGIKWNNQEWAYYDLNYDCDLWANKWKPTQDKINAYKQYIYSLSDPKCDQIQQEFSRTFQAAGEDAYEKIINSGVLTKIKKTPDFRAFVFEHHDVF